MQQQQREEDAINSLHDIKLRSMDVDSASPTSPIEQEEENHSFDYDYYRIEKYFILYNNTSTEVKETKVTMHEIDTNLSMMTDDDEYKRVHDFKQIYLTCCCEEFKSSGGGLGPIRNTNLHMVYPLAKVCKHTAYLYSRHYGYSQKVTYCLLKRALKIAFGMHADFTRKRLKTAWGSAQGIAGSPPRAPSTAVPAAINNNNPYTRCCICLEDIVDGDRNVNATCVSCVQQVHQCCIDRWIGYQIHENLPTAQNQCPMCRGVFA